MDKRDDAVPSISGKLTGRPVSRVDLAGRRFGALQVTAYDRHQDRKWHFWRCQCDCGALVAVRQDSLLRGGSRSCGCLVPQSVAVRSTTHGRTRGSTKFSCPTYRSWHSMKQRCLDPNHENYPRYGGMGVKVSDRWRHSFENFVADLGERPLGHTLDRVDPDGNYEPGNVRWADAVTQNNNQRRHAIKAG